VAYLDELTTPPNPQICESANSNPVQSAFPFFPDHFQPQLQYTPPLYTPLPPANDSHVSQYQQAPAPPIQFQHQIPARIYYSNPTEQVDYQRQFSYEQQIPQQLPSEPVFFDIQPPTQTYQLFSELAKLLPPPSFSPGSPPPPPISPPYAYKPKSRRVDYTKEFQAEFQALLKEKHAKKGWKEFRRSIESQCTYSWCVLVKINFCKKYGGPFAQLLADERFHAIGSRSHCKCRNMYQKLVMT
jgi:hypothetical protein